MDGKRVVKALEAHGFECVRVRGSHHIMRRGSIVIPVPVHGKKDLAKGTLSNIAKITGVKLRS